MSQALDNRIGWLRACFEVELDGHDWVCLIPGNSPSFHLGLDPVDLHAFLHLELIIEQTTKRGHAGQTMAEAEAPVHTS